MFLKNNFIRDKSEKFDKPSFRYLFHSASVLCMKLLFDVSKFFPHCFQYSIAVIELYALNCLDSINLVNVHLVGSCFLKKNCLRYANWKANSAITNIQVALKSDCPKVSKIQFKFSEFPVD